LLEYLGNSLLRLSVFPVPPKGDQKVKISYKFVAPKDGNVVEYIYPLKTDGKATRTLEEFSVTLNIKSKHAVQNVYRELFEGAGSLPVGLERVDVLHHVPVFRGDELVADFHLLVALRRHWEDRQPQKAVAEVFEQPGSWVRRTMSV